MIIYKFGGASVKNAEAVKNLADIISLNNAPLIIVVSAMDKITNALEKLVSNYFNDQNTDENFRVIRDFHINITRNLFENEDHPIFEKLQKYFNRLADILTEEHSDNYDFEYDKIVCFGELISTQIVAEYLNYRGITSKWTDIRKCLKTDEVYRDAKVDWDLSAKYIDTKFTFTDTSIYVTQGFIGSTINNLSTTLGREGSDYTASSLAYLLNAEKVVIWKDVQGIFNADPKFFPKAQKIEKLSYREAVELAYYGAKVIHPKTIKPLQNKNIPLYVNSFYHPDKTGTVITQPIDGKPDEMPNIPVYIIKQEQILISISPLDFSFIAEQNLSVIFALLAKYRIKANLMENSAISFSVCVDNDTRKIEGFVGELRREYKVKYNENLELITIRNYTDEAVSDIIGGRTVIVGQKSRHTARFVVK